MDIWDYNISKYITKNTYDDNNLLYWGEQLEKTASSEKNELSSFYEEDLSNDMNHLLTLYEMALIKLHDCGLNAKMAGQYGSTSGYEEYIQTAKEALSVYNNYMREALEIINSD